jgi:hypothetical protein
MHGLDFFGLCLNLILQPTRPIPHTQSEPGSWAGGGWCTHLDVCFHLIHPDLQRLQLLRRHLLVQELMNSFYSLPDLVVYRVAVLVLLADPLLERVQHFLLPVQPRLHVPEGTPEVANFLVHQVGQCGVESMRQRLRGRPRGWGRCLTGHLARLVRGGGGGGRQRSADGGRRLASPTSACAALAAAVYMYGTSIPGESREFPLLFS